MTKGVRLTFGIGHNIEYVDRLILLKIFCCGWAISRDINRNLAAMTVYISSNFIYIIDIGTLGACAMMTLSNGNIFRVTGHLCGEFTGDRWIPRKGQWRGALIFSLICARLKGRVNNGEAVIWDAIVSIMTSV